MGAPTHCEVADVIHFWMEGYVQALLGGSWGMDKGLIL